MAEHLILSITGFNGKSVPNQFLKQTGEANGLTILLPGLGYTCDMPLFYYTELQFLVGGYDVLRVDYDYRGQDFQPWDNPGNSRRLFEDVSAAVREGLSQREYREVIVVGKSLGTLAMAQLADVAAMPNTWRTVWLTPLLKNALVWQAVQVRTGPMAIVIGTEDHHYDAERLAALDARDNVTVIIQEGGNHSLNAGNSAGESARALADIIGQLDTFHDFADRNAGEMD